MKVFNLKKFTSTDQDYLVLSNAILYHQAKFKGVQDWQYRDEVFEQSNRCTLAYERTLGDVSYVIFEDENWFWFKAKWLK
jgi:hypothetical protein